MRLLWSSEHILCSDCGERSLVFPKLRKFAAKKRVPRPRPRLKPDHPLHSSR
jgi:hypothetical protein